MMIKQALDQAPKCPQYVTRSTVAPTIRSDHLTQDGQEESYDFAVAVVEARRSWKG
jgi:hypothetical protein